jgi:hypothetical protein
MMQRERERERELSLSKKTYITAKNCFSNTKPSRLTSDGHGMPCHEAKVYL